MDDRDILLIKQWRINGATASLFAVCLMIRLSGMILFRFLLFLFDFCPRLAGAFFAIAARPGLGPGRRGDAQRPELCSGWRCGFRLSL